MLTAKEDEEQRTNGKPEEEGEDESTSCIIDWRKLEIGFVPEVDKYFSDTIGVEPMRNIRARLTKPPKYTSLRCNTLLITREDLIERLSKELEPRNKILRSSGRSALIPQKHPRIDDAIVIPTSALKTTSTMKDTTIGEVIVDRRCGEAVLRGADIYCRGIRSLSCGIGPGDRVAVTVELDDRREITKGSDMHKFRRTRRAFIGYGTATMPRREIMKYGSGVAIQMTECLAGCAPSTNDLLEKYIYTQGIPSMVCSHVLAPRPGDHVIDLCAGVGGKSTHLAALMQNRGLLVVGDCSKRKVKKARFKCEKYGIKIAKFVVLDATKAALPKDARATSLEDVLGSRTSSNSSSSSITATTSECKKVSGFPRESFDRVLVDPPCSALGLRPRLDASLTTMAELKSAREYQLMFLRSAVHLVKPGGYMVYSTCTINPLENEGVVRALLNRFSCLRLVDQGAHHLGEFGLKDVGLNESERRKVQRFCPASDSVDAAGFFIAKFVKAGSCRDIPSPVAGTPGEYSDRENMRKRCTEKLKAALGKTCVGRKRKAARKKYRKEMARLSK